MDGCFCMWFLFLHINTYTPRPRHRRSRLRAAASRTMIPFNRTQQFKLQLFSLDTRTETKNQENNKRRLGQGMNKKCFKFIQSDCPFGGSRWNCDGTRWRRRRCNHVRNRQLPPKQSHCVCEMLFIDRNEIAYNKLQ